MSVSRLLRNTAALLAAVSLLALAGCTEPTNPHKQEDRDGGPDDPDAVGMLAPSVGQSAVAQRGLESDVLDPLA